LKKINTRVSIEVNSTSTIGSIWQRLQAWFEIKVRLHDLCSTFAGFWGQERLKFESLETNIRSGRNLDYAKTCNCRPECLTLK